MNAFEAGALEAHGRRAAASAERCLGQLGQLLDAIDLPCDPRRKPHGQESLRAPGAGRGSPEASRRWSMHAFNTSSRDGSPDWSPNPGRNPGSFNQRDDYPTPPYVGGCGGREGGASRTPHTAPPAHGSSRTQHAQRGNAALPQPGSGGCGDGGDGGDGGNGPGGYAGDHGSCSRDSRVTFAGMSLDQVSQ